MSSRKIRHVSLGGPFAYLEVDLLTVGALIAVEKLNRHPTHGTAIAALQAAIQAGEAL